MKSTKPRPLKDAYVFQRFDGRSPRWVEVAGPMSMRRAVAKAAELLAAAATAHEASGKPGKPPLFMTTRGRP